MVIPTHTTRHLEACLTSIAAQRVPPATVVLTCDNEKPELLETARNAFEDSWAQASAGGWKRPTLVHTARASHGVAMLNQVRNNGLRALSEHVHADDIVLIVDGDTVLEPDAISKHLTASESAELVIPYRLDLTEPETEALGDVTSAAALDAAFGEALGPSRVRSLQTRHARYARQLWLRRMLPILVKAHKPKIIGGHHAVRWSALEAVNGYDEDYEGYGYDDDDLARRLFRLTPAVRVSIQVARIHAMHLWHPTRAPDSPTLSPGYATFRNGSSGPRAGRGLATPRDQADSKVTIFPCGSGAS